MTSKNSTSKTNESEVAEAEASVPQQSTSATDKVTVLKGRGEDGKDAIIIGEEIDNSVKAKFNRLIRNKKVLAGVGAVAGLVVIAIIKSAVGANNTEFEYTIAEDVEPEPMGDDTDVDADTTD
jgi:hypothetical protein